MCDSCVSLQSCLNLGCVECNKLLMANDHVLLSGLDCIWIEVHGRNGEKIPLNLQDCLQSEFAARQGSYYNPNALN